MIDWSLILTIAAIFILTLLGAYLRSTVKDRCLKFFRDFPVTLELANNKTSWGTLHLASSGLELEYSSAIQDEQHFESSYVLYSGEYQTVQAIYRYANQLNEDARMRREADIERAFHPRPMRRLARKLRNFLFTATESLNDILGVVVGRAKLATGGQGAITKLSGQALGQVGMEHDPLLERFIGHRVVLNLVEDNEVHEHVGIFQDYSGQFLLLLDVSYPQKQTVKLKVASCGGSGNVCVEDGEGGALIVRNLCDQPIYLHSLVEGKNEQLINAVIGGEERATIYPQVNLEDANLVLRTVNEVDMIVPRSRATIRHRAEHLQEETMKEIMLDVIFDVGTIFSEDKRLDGQEERLREALELDPVDALSAANLGSVLIKKQELEEAEKWLKMALKSAYALPDGGRRARMDLRELERKNGTHFTPATTSNPTAPSS